ncbi:hypothetical protein KAI52_03900 [Candidatus Parcubacteria bacterium]|nr:hypothetical protein [Candidatus Parcubacteria bacterium]
MYKFHCLCEEPSERSERERRSNLVNIRINYENPFSNGIASSRLTRFTRSAPRKDKSIKV